MSGNQYNESHGKSQENDMEVLEVVYKHYFKNIIEAFLT